MNQRKEKQQPKGRSVLYCLLAYVVAVAAGYGAAVLLRFNSPLAAAALADVVGTVVIFLFSMLADNSSVYDPYWSVAPIPIALYWLSTAGHYWSSRQILILCLLALWSGRLTYNWLRGWRGLGHEDWRYRNFRARAGRAYWLVSFLGIHLFPTVLVFLGLLSVHQALMAPAALGALDLLAVLITGGAIWLEASADRQLRAFRRKDNSAKLVLDRGLWSRLRHPNYLGEVLFWWGLFLFALGGRIGNWWAVMGPLAITLLFIFISVPLMDAHLSEGRPAYREYRERTPALLPRLRASGKGL